MEEKSTGPSELALLGGWLNRPVAGEGQRLKLSFAAVFLFGLLAHGFGLTNLLLSHDSLHEFYWTVSKPWKFGLGRFFAPVLRYAMGEITILPWLTGLAGLAFAALAVHLLGKIFRLDKTWQIYLLGGLAVTNVTVTALIATYLHDFAGDMLALALCVAAGWCWQQMAEKFSLKYTLIAGFCLFVSFGLYQAYLAVTATVVALVLIQGTLQGRSAKEGLRHGLRAFPMVILAGGAYFALVFAARTLLDIPAAGDTGNDLSLMGSHLENLGSLLLQGIRQVWQDLFTTHWDGVKGVHDKAGLLVTIVNIVLLIVTLFALFSRMAHRKLGDRLFVLALVLALPLTMSCVSIVSTAFHTLLRYATGLYYLLVLLALSEGKGKGFSLARIGAGVLMSLVLFSNIQIANAAYVQKELEQQATLSTMTRVVDRLEQQPGYVPGQTPVAILGSVAHQQSPLKTGPIRGIIGLYNTTPITSPEVTADYFSIVLQSPMALVDLPRQKELMQTDAYQQMPVFPAAGAIAMVEDVLVVKLSP